MVYRFFDKKSSGSGVGAEPNYQLANELHKQIMNWIVFFFCGMVDQWKAFSLIFSRDHCQRSSPSQISDTLQVGFEPAQNLSSGFVEWRCAVVITTTPLQILSPQNSGAKYVGNKMLQRSHNFSVCLDNTSAKKLPKTQ